MAAVNKNKLLDNATKYIQKGQIDRAIKELQKVIEADPADVRTRLKLGDLFAKKNQNSEAAEQYTLVAESYSKDGFYLKAVAVYKQILKLDSSLIDVHLKLGDLYHQLGLLSDAMGQYQIVATHYDQKGMASESLAVLRKMVELDPENIQSRKKLAEIIVREGKTEDALAEFNKIAEELKAKGRLDDLAGVLERIVHLDQANLDVVRELAALYLDRGDPKRALAKLQICFRANPQDLATLDMLSKAFVALGQPEKAKSVLREISKIHAAAGNQSASMEANRAILQIDPADAEARAAIEGRPYTAPEPSMEAPAAPMPMAPSQPAPAPRASEPPRAAPAPMAAGGGSPDDPQTIQKLLTEADVYLKYGLLEKALDHLRGIVRRNPNNVDAHLKLKDVYLQHKDVEGAVNEIVAVVDLCMAQGDSTRAADALREGLGFAPGHAALEAKRGEIGGGGAGEIAQDPDAVEISIDASENDDGIEIDDPGFEQPTTAMEAAAPEPEPVEEGSVEIQVDGDGEGTDIEVDPEPVDESVSLIDNEAIEPVGDGDVIVDAEPEAEPIAPVVPLHREKSNGSIRMPEPSGISPDQLLNELAGALESTGAPSFGEEEPSIEIDDSAASLDDGPAISLPSDEPEISIDDDEPAPLAAKTPMKSRLDRFADEPAAAAPPAKAQEKAKEKSEEIVIDEPLDLPSDDEPVEDEPIPVAAKAPAPPPPAAAAKPAAAAASVATNDDPVPGEVAEDVDEADFFVKQEIYDEAIAVYKRLLKKYPGNGGLTKRLQRAEALMRGEKPDEPAKPAAKPAAKAEPKPAPLAEPPPRPAPVAEPARPEAAIAAKANGKSAPAAAPVEETGGFDLAAELGDIFEEIEEEEDSAPAFDENEQVSVGDVLREFRKGVDKQIGTEDKDARYNLGIAYREMGLLDEAIGEFQIASEEPSRKADCLSMIGICQRDKGDMDAAIQSFSTAIKTAQSQGMNEKQKASFFYELATTLELAGEAGKAQKAFQQVQALDPGFRDVAEKLGGMAKRGGSGGEGGGDAPAVANKKISFI